MKNILQDNFFLRALHRVPPAVRNAAGSWVLFVLLPLCIYAPAFFVTFGMHNDYSLLPGNFANHQIFPEAPHLFVVGRAIGAYLAIFQYWCINSMRDLGWSRVFAFLLMLAFVALFYRFLRNRVGLERFWATGAAVSLFFLPSSQVYVLLVTNCVPGFFALLLGLGSYFAFDSGMRRFSWDRAAGKGRPLVLLAAAFCLFLAALFIYPPNALFFLVCTFAVLIFSKWDGLRQIFKFFSRDLLFSGAGIAAYFVIQKFYLLPHAPAWVKGYTVTAAEYQFGLTTNILAKASLVLETLLVCWGGVWHSVFWSFGALVPTAFLVIAGVTVLLASPGEARQGPPRTGLCLRSIVMLGICGALFVLINSVPFFAREVFKVIGYRILFSGAVFMALLQFAFFRQCEKVLAKKARAALFLKGCVICFLSASACVSAMNVADVTRNCHREWTFLQEKIQAITSLAYSHVLVVPLDSQKNETLIGRRMPFEMSLMTTLAGLIKPLIGEGARLKQEEPLPEIDAVGKIVLTDPYTYLIDLHDARLGIPEGEAFRLGTLVKGEVSLSGKPGHRVEAIRKDGVLFDFQEKVGTERRPFWQTELNAASPPWLQITFPHKAQELKMFTFAVFLSGVPLAAPIDGRLEASRDGKNWVPLRTLVVYREKANPHFKLYRILDPGFYQMYRFDLVSDIPFSTIRIARMHLLLDIENVQPAGQH